MKKSTLENKFANLAKLFKIPPFETEYVFASPRRFRFDVAFVKAKTAVELDGGTYNRGRHVTGVGYDKDCEKGNLAIEKGWVVLHYTSKNLSKDPAGMVRQILRVLQQRGCVVKSKHTDKA